MKFRLFIAIAASLASSSAMAADGTTMTWNVDGLQRSAIVFAPQTSAAGVKHPLVFAFHGHGGNMVGASRGMHIQDLWPEAVVVYPQGVPTKNRIDPEGLRPGWQIESGEEGDRDLKFFDAMLASVKQKYGVDNTRVYSTGFSNGATFSYLLWAKRSQAFAAFGICAGRLPTTESLTQPRAATIIGGLADPVIPIANQQQAMEAARQIDQATDAGESCGPICTRFGSSSATPVETRIHPGGHVYPPWAAQTFVDFFKAHHL